MSQHSRFDASKSLTALEQDSTIIAKWLVAGLLPGVERQPLKKFDANEETLLLLHRWRRAAETKSPHAMVRLIRVQAAISQPLT